MRETILRLEQAITKLQHQNTHKYSGYHDDPQYIYHLEESIRKY